MSKAQLFITCLGDQFYTSTLRNMTNILERLGVDLVFPPEQTCCGQPLFNNGFEDKTRPVALNFMHAFSKSDAPIIGPSGSCVSMVKHHYPSLFKPGTSEHHLAVDVASRIFEFTEYLVNVLHVTDVGAVYPHKVTYHATCHYLREMRLKTEAKTLLSSVKGLEFVPLKEEETCCGFGGSFTVIYPEVSRSMMENKVNDITASGADTVVMCEPGCLMNIAGGLHKVGSKIRAMHIIDLLAQRDSTSADVETNYTFESQETFDS
jgi:L-lactate dehydrogenase complex protein LldE